jgi:hypothetical protein
MPLPLWDDISLPPDFLLRDINSLEPETLRKEMQALALELWIEETGESWEGLAVREWSDDEGIFAVIDGDEEIVAIYIMTGVENE